MLNEANIYTQSVVSWLVFAGVFLMPVISHALPEAILVLSFDNVDGDVAEDLSGSANLSHPFPAVRARQMVKLLLPDMLPMPVRSEPVAEPVVEPVELVARIEALLAGERSSRMAS